MKIKQPNVAGMFYPEDKEELISMLMDFASREEKSSPYFSRLIIVPHAGIVYSGALAAQGYKYFGKNIKNIFIFAPSHYSRIFGCVVPDYDAFETPLGMIYINKKITSSIGCEVNNEAFEKEHSIEIQLPFIQYFCRKEQICAENSELCTKEEPQVQIIPVLYGCTDYNVLKDTIARYYDNPENAFVISTDLSHFYPERESSRIDNYTAQMIETNNIASFDAEQACGAVGVCGAVSFAKEKNFSLIRVGLTNSAKMTGDSSRVVGYGSWFLYEGGKNDYIKEYFSDFVIDVCRKSILSGFHLGDFTPAEYACVFEEAGAAFVTLELDGNLRGCIGSIIAHRSLIKDIMENAHSAAFRDPRFNPLTREEFDRVKISVSLLSQPERILFESEEDLLTKITPFEDGLIIRDGNYQAVYLPVVWEQLPDKQDFLNSLKQKAGLTPDYFSKEFQAFKFKSLSIKQ